MLCNVGRFDNKHTFGRNSTNRDIIHDNDNMNVNNTVTITTTTTVTTTITGKTIISIITMKKHELEHDLVHKKNRRKKL